MRYLKLLNIIGLISIFFLLKSCSSPTAKQEKASVSKEKISFLEKGQSIALKTKSALGQNLMKAVKEGGATHAIDFCNIRAIPITDSLAQLHDAQIKRVSDNNRNPNNAANVNELSYIKKVKAQIAKGEEFNGEIKLIDGKWVGYYPIITNSMCLQCHGKPKEDIEASTLAMIEKKYPKDEAIGYSLTDLRGIWVIEMPQ